MEALEACERHLQECLEIIRSHGSAPPQETCARVEGEILRLGESLSRVRERVLLERIQRARAEEKFRRVFDSSPFSMSIATVEDGRFIDVNPAFLERLGYEREEIIGKTSEEIGLWDAPEGRKWVLKGLRAHNSADEHHVVTISKDGQRRHARVHTDVVNLDGVPCILGIAEPLEERIRAEEEITRLKRFYEQVLNDLPAEVAVFDTECRYLYLTPSTVPDPEMRDWLIHKTDLDLCGLLGTDVAVAYRRNTWLRETIASKFIGRFEETFVTPAGETKHFIRLYNPVLDGAGEVNYLISYGIDVTDLKQLEEQFNQAQKMEAVGRLAGGIAHDFNNLLTAIIGTTDLIVADSEATEPIRQGVEDIKRSAERAAGLTRQLLAFSRRQVLQPTVLNLNEVIGGMETILRRLIGEHIDLVLDLDPNLAWFKADATQVEQVLMNLVVNSRDALPEGGTIHVRTANITPEPGEVPPALAATPPPLVMLEIADNGMGMTDHVKQHLFEPFFTTKEEGRGTGLGLSTVYAIIDNAGGHIAVESEVSQGTTFRVYLPRAAQTTPAALPRIPRTPGAGGTETILLAEDEDAVRNVVRRILEINGYRVLLATDGMDALEVAGLEEGPIQLLLTDVVMPRMSGRELAQRIKSARPDIHVLFMSGHTDDATVHHVAVHQRNAFIQKPFSATSLIVKIRQILDGNGE
jgi:PAS domain S-box-containing protein